MPTVPQIIARLFPDGTNLDGTTDINRFPRWPPDLFAVAATLVSSAECYCRPRFASGRVADCFFSSRRKMSRLSRLAQQWSKFRDLDESKPHFSAIQSLWDILLRARGCEIADDDQPAAKKWWDAAIALMIIADAASAGMGFVSQIPNEYPLAEFVLHQMIDNMDEENEYLPYLPASLCRTVPSSEACVQPKTLTSQNGFTVRSLSHHLALLPPIGEVATSWFYGMHAEWKEEDYLRPLNLLLIPFPYAIDGNAFVPGGHAIGPGPSGADDILRDRWRFFAVRQSWLMNNKQPISARALSNFFYALMREAEKDVGRIDGIILPELALDQVRAEQISRILASRRPSLQLFICGTSLPTKDGSLSSNSAFTKICFQGERLNSWNQSKHHRWRLDHDQICRYHIGDRLRPSDLWSEEINIEQRQCVFSVFRPGMSLVALVCEDLARVDPVQTVIRSVGPNLVIALLMDGPQLERRWSGRYATVLADDPGSAVLTLTSLGMIRRSVMPGEDEPRQIALWKGHSGSAKELRLPKRAHALLLTLSVTDTTNFTFDGRSDSGATFGLDLSGVRPVRHLDPPRWADVD